MKFKKILTTSLMSGALITPILVTTACGSHNSKPPIKHSFNDFAKAASKADATEIVLQTQPRAWSNYGKNGKFFIQGNPIVDNISQTVTINIKSGLFNQEAVFTAAFHNDIYSIKDWECTQPPVIDTKYWVKFKTDVANWASGINKDVTIPGAVDFLRAQPGFPEIWKTDDRPSAWFIAKEDDSRITNDVNRVVYYTIELADKHKNNIMDYSICYVSITELENQDLSYDDFKVSRSAEIKYDQTSWFDDCYYQLQNITKDTKKTATLIANLKTFSHTFEGAPNLHKWFDAAGAGPITITAPMKQIHNFPTQLTPGASLHWMNSEMQFQLNFATATSTTTGGTFAIEWKDKTKRADIVSDTDFDSIFILQDVNPIS